MPVTKCCTRCNFFYSGPTEEDLAKLQKADWPNHRRKCKLYGHIKQLIEPSKTISDRMSSFKILELLTKHSHEKSLVTISDITESIDISVQMLNSIHETKCQKSEKIASTTATIEELLSNLGDMNEQIRLKDYNDIESEYTSRRAILENISGSNEILGQLMVLVQSICIGGVFIEQKKGKIVELIDKRFSEREKLDYINKIFNKGENSHPVHQFAMPILENIRESVMISDPYIIDSIKLSIKVIQQQEFVVAMRDEAQSVINLGFLLQEDERHYNGLIKRFKEFLTDQAEPGLKVNPNLHHCFKKEHSQARFYIFNANKSCSRFATMANKALEQQSADGLERSPEELFTAILADKLISDCKQVVISSNTELEHTLENTLEQQKKILNDQIAELEQFRKNALSVGDRALAARIGSKIKWGRRDQQKLITLEDRSPAQSELDVKKDLNTENKNAAAQTNRSTSRVKKTK